MRNGHLPAFQNRDVCRRRPDNVRSERARAEEANRVQIRHRTEAAVRGLRILHLGVRFGEMNNQRNSVPGGQRARRLQRLRIVRIWRMRGDSRRNQVVVLELLDECLCTREPVSRRLRVGNRKLDDGLSKHAA